MKHQLLCLLFSIANFFAVAQNNTIIKQYNGTQTRGLVQMTDEGFILAPENARDGKCILLNYLGEQSPYDLTPADIGFAPTNSFVTIDHMVFIGAEYDMLKKQSTFKYSCMFPETGELDAKSVQFFNMASAYYPEYSICISPQKKYIGIVIIPVNKRGNDKKKTAYVFLFSSNMNLIWKREFSFDNKKSAYGLKIACDDQTNLYFLNGFREKSYIEDFKNYFITSYNESQTQTYSLENRAIDHKLLTLCGTQDGVAITGFTLNPENRKFASGTFFLKLQAGSLKVKVQSTNKIAESTLPLFAPKDISRSRMEKANGLLNMVMDNQPYVLQNGTIAVVARHISAPSVMSGASTIGSLFIFFYDITGAYHENVLRINHRADYMMDIFTHRCRVVENKLYILFNDLPSNADIIDQREPEEFKPTLLLLPEETTTYAVILDPAGVTKKIPLVNYKTHNFIMQSAYSFDGISWLLYGTNSTNLTSLNRQPTSILLWIE